MDREALYEGRATLCAGRALTAADAEGEHVRIGHYDVLNELGRGGMGIVFKAIDPRADRTVAIKMIGGCADIATSLQATRNRTWSPPLDHRRRIALVKEARQISKLHHPNIVEVLDYCQHRGLLYIVMEYLEGRSLDRMMEGQPTIALGAKLSVMVQLCDALTYAHNRGLIHRDVKPANTFVLLDGRVKIIDFGLAAELTSLPALRGVVAGTLSYMAPELFSGARYNARTDIWGAGVTFYQLLTGRLPFVGSNRLNLLRSILNDPVPSLDRSIAHFLELDTILSRALAKNPDQRYVSADAFSSDLRALTAEALKDQPLQFEDRSIAELSDVSKGYPDEDNRMHFDIGVTDAVKPVSVKSGQLSGSKTRAMLSYDPGLLVFPLLGVLALFSKAKLRSLRVVLPLFLASLLLYPVGMVVLYPVGIAVGRATIVPYGYIRVHGDLVGLQADRASPGLELLITACVLVSVVCIAWGCVFALLTFIEALSQIPRCQSCHSWMNRKSMWTRYVRNDAAASLGYADCIAALVSNLWEDAAKLLFAHGKENRPLYANALVSTPMRLQLSFFDCDLCNHEAARLTTQDQAGSGWTTRFDYVEAYRAHSLTPTAKPFRAARTWKMALAMAKAAASSVPRLSMNSRTIVFLICLALVPLLVLGLSYAHRHKFRPTGRNEHQGQATGRAVRPAYPK